MSVGSKVRVKKDDSQSVRIFKLYKRLERDKAGVSLQSFLKEEVVTEETLTKDLLCINQFLNWETPYSRRVIKEKRTDRIRLINQSYMDLNVPICKKSDYSETPPYLLLRLDLEIEKNGRVHREKWMNEIKCSKRTFARYVAKINNYYSMETCATEDDMIKSVGKGWYAKKNKKTLRVTN